MMLRLMLLIGPRSRRFPILKVNEVPKAAKAIGTKFCWKFIAMVLNARPGSVIDVDLSRDASGKFS